MPPPLTKNTRQETKVAEKLVSRDVFPSLSLKIVGGAALHLPGDLNTPLTILLFYRGHW